MGASQGGDVTEINFSHPTLGKGSFFPKAKESNTLDPGGFRNEDDANKIDGKGSLIITKNRVRAHFEGVIANDMNERNDLQVAKDLAAHSTEADWTISLSNGTVWGGKGIIVGDIAGDTDAATFSMKLAFGNLKKIIG